MLGSQRENVEGMHRFCDSVLIAFTWDVALFWWLMVAWKALTLAIWSCDLGRQESHAFPAHCPLKAAACFLWKKTYNQCFYTANGFLCMYLLL